jgi:hypothetical protein
MSGRQREPTQSCETLSPSAKRIEKKLSALHSKNYREGKKGQPRPKPQRERGATRPFEGKLENWTYAPINDTGVVASVIRRALHLQTKAKIGDHQAVHAGPACAAA